MHNQSGTRGRPSDLQPAWTRRSSQAVGSDRRDHSRYPAARTATPRNPKHSNRLKLTFADNLLSLYATLIVGAVSSSQL